MSDHEGTREPTSDPPLAKVSRRYQPLFYILAMIAGALFVGGERLIEREVKAANAPTREYVDQRDNGQQQQINDLAARMLANDATHQAINDALKRHDDADAEQRAMIVQIYEGGARRGLWNRIDAPSPSAIVQKGVLK